MTRSNLLSKFNEGIQQSHCKSYRVFQYFTLYDSAKSNVIQNTLLQLFFCLFAFEGCVAKRWLNGPFSGLRQFLTTESPLKMMKNTGQKCKHVKNEKSFWHEIKSIFHHFLSRASIDVDIKNILEEESPALGPL